MPHPHHRIVSPVIRHILRAHERENTHERFLSGNLAENEKKKVTQFSTFL